MFKVFSTHNLLEIVVRRVSNHALHVARQLSFLDFPFCVRLKFLPCCVYHRQSCLVSAQVNVGHSLAYAGVSFEDNVPTLGCEYNLILLGVAQHNVASFCEHGDR